MKMSTKGPSLPQIQMLAALQRKKPGEVYAGTARNRTARRRLALAKQRRSDHRRLLVTIRSAYARTRS